MRSNRWLVFGSLATVVLVLGGAFLVWRLSGFPALNRETQRQTYDRAVARIVLDHLENSDVVVRAKAGATGVAVERKLRWNGDAPDIRETWDGDTLTISVDCPGWSFGRECTVDYALDVPAPVRVEGDLSSGDVTLEGLAGAARVATTSGDIRVRGFTGDSLDVRSTSGDLVMDNLATASLKATATSGDLRAAFTEPPTDVDASCTSGDVTLTLPRSSMTYRVHLEATSGDLDSDLTSTDGGTGSISARTTSGDVRIRLS